MTKSIMSESSMMMMRSKLKLEQLSPNPTGVGAKYRWFGKIMGMTMDFSQTVTKWQPPKFKEWETVGEAKIIIMSWYCNWCLNNMLNDTKKELDKNSKQN